MSSETPFPQKLKGRIIRFFKERFVDFWGLSGESKFYCVGLMILAASGVTALVRGGSASQKESILPAVAGGEHLLALAVDDRSHHNPHDCRTTATLSNGQYELSGNKVAVIDGHVADTLIVSAVARARTPVAGGERFELDVTCRTARGTLAISGTAEVTVPSQPADDNKNR